MENALLEKVSSDIFKENRISQWNSAVALLYRNDDNNFSKEVLALGHCELIILDMEKKNTTYALHYINTNETHSYFLENPYLVSQTEGFSRYWIYGLYEVLRTFKQYLCEQANLGKQDNKFPEGEFECFNDFFFTLKTLRIPLAKHELVNSKKLKHSARIVYGSVDGVLGWEVYCPKQKSYITLTRRQIADTFLELAGKIQENRR